MRAGPGYLAVSAAAVLWAVGGTLASRLIRRGAVVVELTQARSWIAVIGLGLLVAARRRPAPGSARVPEVVAFGLSIAAANFFYYTALSRLPVAVAIVVQYTAPGLVVLWVALRERRKPSGRVVRALVLALAGVVLLSGLPRLLVAGRIELDGLGIAAALASSVAFATYMLTGERVERALGADRGLLMGFVVSSLLWIAVALVRGFPHTAVEPRFLPWVLFLGVFTTLAPFLLFVWGLGRVSASRAGIVSTLEPLTAAVLAFAWLGQRLTPMQLVGAGMVLAGIAVVQSERPSVVV